MSVADFRRFQTSPAHTGKLRNTRLAADHNTFIRTFVVATVVGIGLLYLMSLVTSVVAGMTEVVYLQGGGLWENMPLNLFALFMAFSFIPLAFPLPLFLVAGAFALVPPINWFFRRAVVYLQRKFRRRNRTGQIYQMRPTIK